VKRTLGIVGLLVVGSAVFAQNAEMTYYPLKVGSKWTYRVGGQQMVLEVKRFDDVDGVKCAVLETRADNLIFSECVAPGADGLYRYKAQDSKITPPICFFKVPPQRGLNWEVDSAAGKLRVQGTFRMDEIEVTVPAGKFKTFVSSFDVKQDGQMVSISIYLAPGVGMVKQRMNVGGQEVLVELEKYEEGK
jgi:hypothetical protein